MILDDLVAYLDANSTLLTAGTNLFVAKTPHTPATCVTLFESGGLAPQWAMGGSAPVMERPRIQAIARSTSYQTGRTYIETVWTKLDHTITNSTVVTSTAPRYLRVAAVQSPFPIGLDENQRYLFSVNFDVDKERT